MRRDKSNIGGGTKNTHAHGSKNDPSQDSISSALQGKQRDKIPACGAPQSCSSTTAKTSPTGLFLGKPVKANEKSHQAATGELMSVTMERRLSGQLFVQRSVSCRSLRSETICNYWTHGLEQQCRSALIFFFLSVSQPAG